MKEDQGPETGVNTKEEEIVTENKLKGKTLKGDPAVIVVLENGYEAKAPYSVALTWLNRGEARVIKEVYDPTKDRMPFKASK